MITRNGSGQAVIAVVTLLVGLALGAGATYYIMRPAAQPPPTGEPSALPESYSVSATEDVVFPRSLANTTEFDFDGDGTTEQLELWVDAERQAGEWLWDDGQRWLLVIRDGGQLYPLFDDFIQLGLLRYHVFRDDSPVLFSIESGHGVQIHSVVYDGVAGHYVVETIFSNFSQTDWFNIN